MEWGIAATFKFSCSLVLNTRKNKSICEVCVKKTSMIRKRFREAKTGNPWMVCTSFLPFLALIYELAYVLFDKMLESDIHVLYIYYIYSFLGIGSQVCNWWNRWELRGSWRKLDWVERIVTSGSKLARLCCVRILWSALHGFTTKHHHLVGGRWSHGLRQRKIWLISMSGGSFHIQVV